MCSGGTGMFVVEALFSTISETLLKLYSRARFFLNIQGRGKCWRIARKTCIFKMKSTVIVVGQEVQGGKKGQEMDRQIACNFHESLCAVHFACNSISLQLARDHDRLYVCLTVGLSLVSIDSIILVSKPVCSFNKCPFETDTHYQRQRPSSKWKRL